MKIEFNLPTEKQIQEKSNNYLKMLREQIKDDQALIKAACKVIGRELHEEIPDEEFDLVFDVN